MEVGTAAVPTYNENKEIYINEPGLTLKRESTTSKTLTLKRESTSFHFLILYLLVFQLVLHKNNLQ